MTSPATSVESGAGGSGFVGGAVGRARDWGPPVVLLAAILVVWELAVRVFQIKQFILPGPVEIAVAWQTYLPELLDAASYTFLEIIGGLVIGASAGIIVGAITARYRSMQDSLHAIRGRGELGADPRVRAAVQQLVRPGPAAVEGDDRGGPVFLPGHDQHGPGPDHRRPAGPRARCARMPPRRPWCSASCGSRTPCHTCSRRSASRSRWPRSGRWWGSTSPRRGRASASTSPRIRRSSTSSGHGRRSSSPARSASGCMPWSPSSSGWSMPWQARRSAQG